jgi:hypothetical protein
MSRSSRSVRLAAIALATAVAFITSRRLTHREATAEQPALAATPSPAELAHADLHGRYAEARLRLAQANLAQAEHLAETVPGQVGGLELASLRRRIEVLKRHVVTSREQAHGNGFGLATTAAMTAVRQAEDELATARSANMRQPETVSQTTLRQLEAAAELAQARLAVWNDPSFLDSPLQVMQMQIDQLADEVFDLVHRVDNRFLQDRR